MMAPEDCQTIRRAVDVQVSGLVGAALDWAVWLAVNGEPGEACRTRKLIFTADRTYWQPSEDWSQGGPLIEANQVSLHCPQTTDDVWAAWIITNKGEVVQAGDTALIAACRAVVAARLGEVVSVPAELVEQINA